MAFLPRHGRGHRISPTEIPVRANIWALKSLGVEWVISVSAVGSLREHIAPRDLIIPDQLFDRTKSRVNTFFEGGIDIGTGGAPCWGNAKDNARDERCGSAKRKYIIVARIARAAVAGHEQRTMLEENRRDWCRYKPNRYWERRP